MQLHGRKLYFSHAFSVHGTSLMLFTTLSEEDLNDNFYKTLVRTETRTCYFAVRLETSFTSRLLIVFIAEDAVDSVTAIDELYSTKTVPPMNFIEHYLM